MTLPPADLVVALIKNLEEDIISVLSEQAVMLGHRTVLLAKRMERRTRPKVTL